MIKHVGNEKLMVKVCNLYYIDDLKQEEIAKKLGLSRPTISRLLKDAKEAGIVKIQIISPFTNDYSDLEKTLELKYGLKNVIIVNDQSDDVSQKQELAQEAASYLERILKPKDIVGLSMGTTLREIPQFVSSRKDSKITFVPLLGGVGQANIEIHPNQIVMEVANAFGGNYMLLHAPAVVSDPSLIKTFKEELGIKHVMEMMKKVNVAVVGLGALLDQNSTMMATGYYDKKDIELMKKKKAVGDICMQSYNADGEAKDFDSNQKVIGYPLENLKKIETVVAVAGGTSKLEAIKGAIKGGYINVLITNYSNGVELEKQ
ncbi:sugar-binding transcriptional regulator [Sinanaerobacter chloroacetimidivorans]|jgi:deoxyribonucleoside regulator|uniref:Sugar-binding transcriptional regulator n=1 Tax=Sinanaerobacter chloroacetimidivorans TaxID=2818044 RepID=A0A8J7W448_9FIRM|nr:sugar-binding transcriptional regulator [Sinanaerobacter chloroacetimidivorans]MBR0600602.1 sugar-binding transcriptional regulator [Sinanaerobacter chloroacetimidivorans]